MTIGSVTPSDQAITEVLALNDVRTLVAKHLGVSVARVTDEAHFTDDLGADWLDRRELMMVVEDQFAGLEITDEDVDRIEVVGDPLFTTSMWRAARHTLTGPRDQATWLGAQQPPMKEIGPRVTRGVIRDPA